MALVALIGGGFAEVDDDDLPLVEGREWRRERIAKSRTLYARARGPYRTDSLMHRLIAGAERGQIVDHIDGNGLNNRRSNLRLCTHQQNIANRARQVNGSGPYKGVSFCRQKRLTKPWRAAIGGHKSVLFIGCFSTAEEAAAAYDIAAVLRYGEFACLNFPHVFPELSGRKA